jgi:phenylalanyl-tRNA synthetase beta chain
MEISLAWLNQYLDPGDVAADEAERVLTHAGYPVEGRRDAGHGDTTLTVELTSNRGDLLAHIGCAREIAAARSAARPRRLVEPAFSDPSPGPPIDGDLSLENLSPDACPLFTARLIRGCRIGPSPGWLVRRLEAVGQRSISNAVDITNFITLELGNPCHVFDLASLRGGRLIVRRAHAGERLTTLDGRDRVLEPGDVVVADTERAVSLAGVMGGKNTEVTTATRDIVFEMATWDPVAVRTAARRLSIRTDASHRFERIVDQRTIDAAARRAVALLCELTGGVASSDSLREGRPDPAASPVTLRPARCDAVLGVSIPRAEAAAMLRGHGVSVEDHGASLRCTPPPFRPDLTREIDLIEEIARTAGYEAVPVRDRIEIRASHPQESERARRELGAVLTGLGFWETVTFSFVRPEHAAPWLGQGLIEARVDDERRGAEPTLRPSALPSLLLCRRANADAQVSVPGGVRLYELSAVFAQTPEKRTLERRTLTLLLDVEGVALGRGAAVEQVQAGLRAVRGAVEHVCRAMAGPLGRVEVRASGPDCPGWMPAGFGRVSVGGREIGVLGVIADSPRAMAGLDVPVVGAELDLDALLSLYPPRGRVEPLPAFPGIERDLSLVVAESVPWGRVAAVLAGAGLESFESVAFVGTYRGAQVGPGRKSVTARLRFSRPDRTLRHGDVDPQIAHAVAAAAAELGATLRA